MEKVSELIKLIQTRLANLLKDAPSDVQEAYAKLKDEIEQISSL